MENSKILPVYSRLGDEESRFLFETRLCYSHDTLRMVRNINENNFIYKKWSKMKKDFFMFGAGYFGHFFVKVLPKIKWCAFIDNDITKVGKSDILPVISFQEFIKKSGNALVFLSCLNARSEMYQQLIINGFPKDSTIMPFGYGDRYFDLPYFKYSKKEFFIDAGGYDGDTAKLFFRWLENAGRGTGRSVIFEPNFDNYCKNNMQNYDNVVVVNKGLWHKKETLRFYENKNNPGGSRISSEGEKIIETISLDEYLKNEKDPVTFIKMDIEGAELNALKGAERTIKKHKPKLAICIYHKPEDVWEIPNLLFDFVPDYKFYIRHYSFTNWDTVLYAVPPD